MGNKNAPKGVQYSHCKHFSLATNQCRQCSQTVCAKCFGFPLLTCPRALLADAQLQEVCRNCFVDGTQVTFGQWWEVLGKDNKKEVVFLHAEGFSRRMFREHAEALTAKGYRCVMVDLPGHGALIDEEFTVRNCLKVIGQTLSQHCLTSPVPVVGCSLAALALIEYLALHQCAFKKMILLSCCFKLYSSLDFLSPAESRQAEGKKIINQAARKNLRASTFMNVLEGGLYPLKRKEKREFAQRVNPYESLKRNKGYVPILFINGSEEDRKHEDLYFSVAGAHSYLLVYEPGDVYFWCEEAHFYRLLNDITYFLNKE